MAELSYKDQQDLKNIEKIREHLQILPRFCGEYFRSLEIRKSTQIPVRTTLMIWVYFFIFLRPIIPILRIKTYIRCLLRSLI